MATSQTINAFVLADEYLKYLGWPSTPVTRRVMAAWFMRESSRSGDNINVVGNNPLNISCTTCSNYRAVFDSKGRIHKIVVFSTPQQGMAAFKTLINGSGPGYAGIVKAFKASPNAAGPIILAINQSGWVTGTTNSYVSNGKSTLADTYNGLILGGSGDPISTAYDTSHPPSDTSSSSTSTTLTAFNGLVTFPRDKILTQADVDSIYKKLLAAGWFGGDPTQAVAGKIFYDAMSKTLVGKPWNDTTLAALTKQTGIDASQATPSVNSPGINVVVDVFGALAGKAVAVAAILLGVGLVVGGAVLIAKDVYSGGGTSMVDPTPIIVRQ